MRITSSLFLFALAAATSAAPTPQQETSTSLRAAAASTTTTSAASSTSARSSAATGSPSPSPTAAGAAIETPVVDGVSSSVRIPIGYWSREYHVTATIGAAPTAKVVQLRPDSSDSILQVRQDQYDAGADGGTDHVDSVSVGGLNASGLAIGVGARGLIPLGIPSNTSTPLGMLPAAAVEQGSSEIGLFYKRVAFGVNQTADAGELAIGPNTALFTQPLNYIPTTTPTDFTLPLGPVTIGNMTVAHNGTAKLVTAGSYFLGPSAAVAAFYALIPGAKLDSNLGAWSFPCNVFTRGNTTTSLTLGGHTYPLAPADMVAFFVDSAGRAAYDPSRDPKAYTGMCVGSVQARTGQELRDSMQVEGGEWTLGTAFLKNVYTVVRYGAQPAVGFATLKDGVQVDVEVPVVGNSAGARRASAGMVVVAAVLAVVVGM